LTLTKFEKQQYIFEEIKNKLSSLPNDISELQILLRPLLKNIIVNEYEKDLIGTKEFYIPEDSIFMMTHNDSYKTEYIKFLLILIILYYFNYIILL